jgi:hypothetical protein
VKMEAGIKGLRIVSNSPTLCKCFRVARLACSVSHTVGTVYQEAE